ncbi:MAG: hypothetical protein J4G06_06980 [Caldilineaceae bacterium]|nr:hypothetical protein [Caldilineaceae bacterium]
MSWSDCDAPSLNAQYFEEMGVVKVWENLLTASNIRKSVGLVDEKMDGIIRE